MYLTAGLHRSVQKHPDKTATITGERRQTFKQLENRVAHTAGALRALGLQPGERLSVLAQNSDRMMELLLAGWWAGLVVNPINTRWSAAEVSYALRDCAASALAVDDALWPVAQALESDLPALRHRLYMGQGETPQAYQSLEALVLQAPAVEDVRCATDSLAAIVYTGGTTGFLHVAGLGRMLGQTIVGGTMDQDGYLYVIDRIKDMVITGGENVYPAEVENVLCSHPAVQSCAVMGVPHEKWGEAVHAVVVLCAGAQATSADLDAHCRSQIGAFKCPKSYDFCAQLPMTAAGKVQKTQLRQSVNRTPQP